MPKLDSETWDKNRQSIVSTAFGLFSQRGYSRVSVNDIIKDAGISKGCFYTYFSSKQEVFLAIVAQSDGGKDKLAAGLDAGVAPAERLERYLRLRLKSFLQPKNKTWIKFSSEFWSTADMDAGMKKLNRQRYAAFAQDIQGLVRQGMERGQFRKDIDLDAAAYVLMSLIDGVASMSAVMQHTLSDRRIDAAVDMVMRYLAPGGNMPGVTRKDTDQ